MSEPSKGRLLVNLMADTKTMTVETCLSMCYNYNYAGLEYGGQCWCDNKLNWAGNTGATPGANISESQCKMTCRGNSSEFCGAGVRLNLYAKRSIVLT